MHASIMSPNFFEEWWLCLIFDQCIVSSLLFLPLLMHYTALYTWERGKSLRLHQSKAKNFHIIHTVKYFHIKRHFRSFVSYLCGMRKSRSTTTPTKNLTDSPVEGPVKKLSHTAPVGAGRPLPPPPTLGRSVAQQAHRCADLRVGALCCHQRLPQYTTHMETGSLGRRTGDAVPWFASRRSTNSWFSTWSGCTLLWCSWAWLYTMTPRRPVMKRSGLSSCPGRSMRSPHTGKTDFHPVLSGHQQDVHFQHTLVLF